MSGMDSAEYDVVIVGGGTAGMVASIYACRAGLSTVLLERMMIGGQVVNAEQIENLPGFSDGIAGVDFGQILYKQATKYGLEVQLSDVTGLKAGQPNWTVETSERNLSSKSVILAGGSTLKKLHVPGEDRLHGAGVSYCATCDGHFFLDQVVGVVGGGDSALDEALVLTEFASKVIMFHRRDRFRGQKILQDRVLSHEKIEIHWNTVVDEVMGTDLVKRVKLTNVITGEPSIVDLSGVFIYVGLKPNTDYLSGIVMLDNAGHVPTDIRMRTDAPGLLAAGDIRQGSMAQLATAAGDGATAAIIAQRYIESGVWSQ